MNTHDRPIHQKRSNALLFLGYAAEAMKEAKPASRHGESPEGLEVRASFLGAFLFFTTTRATAH
jgi:hypothetical protein